VSSPRGTALVTGATGGIGRATAKGLVERGYRVVIGARSASKGQAVAAEIGAADCFVADFTSLKEVVSAARAYLTPDLAIDLLVNNAGVGGQRGRSAEGFELAFGVNHLAHFALTTWLLPALLRAPSPRVLMVSSKAHYAAKGFDWASLERKTRTFTGFPEYSNSKLANVLFAKELNRRFSSLEAVSAHPGVVASKIWRRIPWPFRAYVTRSMLSEEQGAATLLALCDAESLVPGAYYHFGGEREPSALARDGDLARELWSRSDAWLEGLGLQPRPES
jgi:NAD(P)-dependent dehydrogenase (short-subunit alcohol dehydrogenase family)